MNDLRYWLSKFLYKLSVLARPKPKFKDGDIVIYRSHHYKVDSCVGDFYPTRIYLISSLNLSYYMDTALESDLVLAPKFMQILYK